MRILYPFNPLNEKEADEPYQEEFLSMKNAGIDCSLFDFDSLDFEFRPRPKIQNGDIVLYRGWMLPPEKYSLLVNKIVLSGANAVTSGDDYVKCHHMPGWYDQCKAYTPETCFFSNDEKLLQQVSKLGWEDYFVKDYVKSNSNEEGSIAKSPEQVIEIVSLIEKFRGSVEGGVSIRRVEPFVEGSEKRYFAFGSKVYSPDEDIPKVVQEIASLVNAPFFSIDTILLEDGSIRLVEIGDGQVSDKKTWPLDRFVKMIIENAS